MKAIRPGTVEVRIIGAKPDLRRALEQLKALHGDALHVFGVERGKSEAYVGRAALLIPQSK